MYVQVTYRLNRIHVYIKQELMKKTARNLKENKERYVVVFDGRKGKEEIM